MINKNQDPWELDIRQVQRIKSGLLKYIGGFQISKGKDKSSLSPSQPKTPQPMRNSKQSKKSARNNQSYIEQPPPLVLEKQKPKDKTPINNTHNSMAKGFWRSKTGKIMRQGEVQIEVQQIKKPQSLLGGVKLKKKQLSSIEIKNKKQNTKLKQSLILNFNQNEEFPQIKLSQIPKKQPQAIQIYNEKNNFPQFSSASQPLIIPQMEKFYIQYVKNDKQIKRQKQPQKSVKIESKTEEVPKVQNSFQMNVSQIAKLFGGSGIKNEPNISLKKQRNFNPSPAVEQMKSKKTEHEKQSLSIASFGMNEKKNFPKKRSTIAQFLQIHEQTQQKSKFKEKTRKRSHTEDNYPEIKKISMNSYRQNKQITNKNNKIILGSPDKNIKNTFASTTRAGKKYESEIQFTQEQRQLLKRKYHILTTKLQNLKQKVIQQSQSQQMRKINRVSEYNFEQIQAIMLYNRFSPLKVLQKKREQKKRQFDKELYQTYRPNKQKHVKHKKDKQKSFIF